MSFPSISPKQSFPALESEVLAYWKANNTFQKSIDSRPASDPYRFYDGPPFITGTPHYGSLLSSVVKDVVGRYWTMRGKRVDRVWGWDCHGLPIEEKVQKKMGLHSNKEIEAHGVKEFIDGCYEYTQSTSAEWDWYIDKIGRWVDMDNAYRTMDQDYMESVMWVFSQLWNKGLIYEGKRVSLYSWKLSTPISNFEVAMDDTYQEVNDPAITVKFEGETKKAAIAWVIDEKERFLLGWSYKYNGWHLVGGATHDQETIKDCLVREVYEEIGVAIEKNNIKEITQDSQIDGGKIWMATHFEVRVNSEDIKNGEPEKFREWKWFTKEELAEAYNDIYNVDRLPVDMFLGRAPLDHIKKISFLAWTTTPWTIPANMALAVGADIDYVLVESNSEGYIVAKNRIETVFKGKGEYMVIRELKGSDLVGLSYIPPFPEYFHGKMGEQNHKVYAADFATDTDGTGIVHIAPEFGDVDFGLAKEKGITVTEALDNEGKYTAQIADHVGLHYLDANKTNIERMKANNTLFKNEGVTHRVPFCPRSGTPLVQKAQKSWFIDIQSQKEKLIKANEQINWFPEYLKEGRFKKGIESAPDWCISRTRFWGAPMPVWMNPDGSEKLVVASREEIFELNQPYGQLEKKEIDGKVRYFFKGGEFDGTDLNLHRPYIDSIYLQSPKTGNKLTRTPEVLDVWMDSGSMPYAQMHYPFENQTAMEASFPADFIAEYVGQVRAWFYVMHVLGVLLNPTKQAKPTPSFTNVITTGVINGNDGRKMSKSFGNYPDPRLTIEKYGADPIRFYMLNSPLLSGGDMDFKEEGILETIKGVMLPIWNTYSFFTTYANIDGWEKSDTPVSRVNPLDRWIISRLQVLIETVHASMDGYDVSRACRAIVDYMDELTNWYVRLSRRRFWGSEMTDDKASAYDTLYTVLVELSKLLAPYMPFLSESIFQGLTKKESVHLEYITLPDTSLVDESLNRDMQICEQIVSLGLALRSNKNIRVRQPLASVTITRPLDEYYQGIIRDELNVKTVKYDDPEKLAKKIAKPDARKIGPKYGKNVQEIITEGKNGNFVEKENGVIEINGYTLESTEYTYEYVPYLGVGDVEGGYGMVIAMDTEISEDLKLEGYARDIIRMIQEMRKDAGYQVTDRISICITGEGSGAILDYSGALITQETLSVLVAHIELPDGEKSEILEGDCEIQIQIKK